MPSHDHLTPPGLSCVSTKFGHISGLDGLRALSVLVVMLYHSDLPFVQGGYLGVEIFFVISGFLITKIMLHEASLNSGKIDLVLFWKRRAARLLPALFLLLFLVTLIGAFVLKDRASQYRFDIIASLFYFENWYQIYSSASYFSDQGLPLLKHIWSLAVEEQFYLVWPLLFALLLRAAKGKSGYLVAATLSLFTLSFSAMICLTMTGNQPEAMIADSFNRAYLGTDTRAFGILAGALLAMSSMKTKRIASSRYFLGFFSFAAIVGLLYLCSFLEIKNPFLYKGGFLIVDMLTLVVIYSFLKAENGIITRFFCLKPLEWVGKRSYGIYLWHWPLFKLVGAGEDGYDFIAIRFIVTLVVAEISFRYLETPLRKAIIQTKTVKRRKPNRLAIASACSTMVVIVLWSGMVLSHQKPYVDEVQRSLAMNAMAIDLDNAITDSVEPGLPEDESLDSIQSGKTAGYLAREKNTNSTDQFLNTRQLISAYPGIGGSVALSEKLYCHIPENSMTDQLASLRNPGEPSFKRLQSGNVYKNDKFQMLNETSDTILASKNFVINDPSQILVATKRNVIDSSEMNTAPPSDIDIKALKNVKITAIGDSVMKGAAIALKKKLGAQLGKNSVIINAEVSRSFGLAYNILAKYKQDKVLGDVVVIHLGTNNSQISKKEFKRLMALLSDRSLVVFLTVKSHKTRICENVNFTLENIVRDVPNARILDWKTLADVHPELFYTDRTHLRPDGARFYASMVFNFIARHAKKHVVPHSTTDLAKIPIKELGGDHLTAFSNLTTSKSLKKTAKNVLHPPH